MTHIYIILSNVQALYNDRAVTILIFRGLPPFDSYEPDISWILWKELELSLDDSNKPVDHYEQSFDRLQFASAFKYLFMDTYNPDPIC